MAKAPRPGAGKRQAAAQEAQTELRVTIRGEAYSSYPGNLPFRVSIAVRKVTGGLPYVAFWNGENAVDMDSLQLAVWVSRMCAGETALTIDDVVAGWPAGLTEDEIDVEQITADEADDPDEDSDPNESGPS